MADTKLNIIVELKNLARKGLTDLRTQFGQLTKSTSNATSAATALKRALLGIGGILAIKKAVGVLADFEQAMSTVKAITRATEIQFVALTETAKRLGATTRFTATQAAEGMLFLSRAGFSTNKVLASIEATLNLAQAGALDLGRAADIASNILTGFRLKASDAARVVDVLALAANSSNTNVEQLGEAMKLVAPVAAGLGVSLEEATAAVAALSDAGLQGTLAGTGLRRTLSELESPSMKTRGILKSLGLTVDDVRVTSVGLAQALKNLKNAGVDTGLALEIFGDRGGPAFEVMSSSIPKIDAMNEKLKGAAGTAKRIADIMDDNLNGAILKVKSAMESLILSMGEAGGSSRILRTLLEELAAGIRILPQVTSVAFATVFEKIALGVRGARIEWESFKLGILGFNLVLSAVTAVFARFFDFIIVNLATLVGQFQIMLDKINQVADDVVPDALIDGLGEVEMSMRSAGLAATGFTADMVNGTIAQMDAQRDLIASLASGTTEAERFWNGAKIAAQDAVRVALEAQAGVTKYTSGIYSSVVDLSTRAIEAARLGQVRFTAQQAANAAIEKENQEFADRESRWNEVSVQAAQDSMDAKNEINVKEYDATKALADKAAEENRQRRDLALQTGAQSATDMAGVMSAAFELSGQKTREFMIAQKAFTIAATLISTYSAAQKAYESTIGIPYVGSVLAPVAAATAVAAGLSRIAIIASQSFAEGGMVQGSSPSPTADNVLVNATAGEYVHPVSSVGYYGKGIMEAIRSKAIPRDALAAYAMPGRPDNYSGHFATGGSVGRGSVPEKTASGARPESPRINNIIDPHMFSQFVNSAPGEDDVVNVISRRIFDVKQLLGK